MFGEKRQQPSANNSSVSSDTEKTDTFYRKRKVKLLHKHDVAYTP